MTVNLPTLPEDHDAPMSAEPEGSSPTPEDLPIPQPEQPSDDSPPEPGSPAPEAEAEKEDKDDKDEKTGRPKKSPDPPEPEPYDEVITDKAVTQGGLFKVHKVGSKHYLELTPDLYGRDMIWYSEFAEAPERVALSARVLGERVVRWRRYENYIEVLDMGASLRLRSDYGPGGTAAEPDAMKRAIDAVTLPAILFSFPVAAEGEGNSAVIDVTAFFNDNLEDFDLGPVLEAAHYDVGKVDPVRSRILKITSFPSNLMVRSMITFYLGHGRSSAVSIVVAHSLTLLPEEPMSPRLFDPRVGYFTTSFGLVDAHERPGIVDEAYITRFRLDKANPDAAISDPVRPITFYLTPEIPARWLPFVRQGVADWQPAFEEAGFSNAIFAADAPDDPDWDPADARHSVIRWVPQVQQNAMGPQLIDPRTGEVLSAHVIIWEDVLKIIEEWYFTQVGAVDPRAQRLPLPDEVMGTMVRYVVCHEVGHSIGLRHNHRASQAFTTAQLRDPEFSAIHGPSASIMSYGRFNYVAQPGDGVTQLVPIIGPYDLHAIHWGYRPIPGAASPKDEEATLNEWASAVRDNSWLEFGGEDSVSRIDPTVLTENVGANRIESGRLGIANLERILDFIVAATTRDHESFDLLEQMYLAIIDNRTTWLESAAKELGGVIERRTLAAGEEPFKRVNVARQREILSFLIENLRQGQSFLRPEIVNRIMPINAIQPVIASQTAVLRAMLAEGIYKQLMDATILEPEIAYPLPTYLTDIKNGLFAEIREEQPVVQAIMRDSQRHFIATIKYMLATYDDSARIGYLPFPGQPGIPSEFINRLGSKAQGTDFRGAARMMLRELRGELSTAAERTTDPNTKAHFEDLLLEVEQILTVK